MANFSLIDYLFGLYINININEGQNKFEVHISKNGPKIANLWAKMSQLPPCMTPLNGLNLVNF